jgi:transcriptional regulator with XRE-family HTH domain
MAHHNELGDYLRARRSQVDPQRVGLPGGGTRRVSGLRREELASLAGVSVDYYTRLEQGRERHPSTQVLDALARALQLGPDAQRYLHAIAAPAAHVGASRARTPVLSESLLRLVDDWPMNPAVILDRRYNVISSNQLGEALFSNPGHNQNIVELLFLEPFGRELFVNWDEVARSSVAALRSSAAYMPDDAELKQLVGKLSIESTEFSDLWAQADVKEKTSGALVLQRPEVGVLELEYTTLQPNGSSDALMKVYRAEAGSETHERLLMLGSLTAQGSDAGGHNAAAHMLDR